ncbi:hypothetical protein M6B38_179520 [Iris pallida]|uniref:Secreted protein n=1 Tax=Iris pallida TaxID=29817 RepID=A0AAX6EN75_IRIPA|nr:hypothetical protein M6B38_179520 [Iris pallida]
MMLSCVTTAITILSCTLSCCQSPRRRTMRLRLIDRFHFCIAYFIFKILYFPSEHFYCIKFQFK